jgi:hypothetical protein
MLEKNIGGEPFIEDLTKYSLAQKFLRGEGEMSLSRIPAALSKPLVRAGLKTGETIENIPQQFIRKISK